MLAQERHAIIMETLRQNKVIRISDIANRFGISNLTARRDLDALQDQNLIRRVYGGAVLMTPAAGGSAPKPKKVPGDNVRRGRRAAIAREAAKMVQEGDRLHLGNGIVVEELARRLCSFRRLSIVTGSLAAADQLLNSSHDVYLLGGKMNHDERNLSGSYALQMARDFHVNYTFVPCGGISAERGILSDHLPAAELGRVAIESAETVVVLCSSDMIDRVTFHSVCPISMVDVLITDEGITPEQKETLEACGLKVVVAVYDESDISEL